MRGKVAAYLILVCFVYCANRAASADPEKGSVDERLDRLEKDLEAEKKANRQLRRELETIERRQFDAGEAAATEEAPSSSEGGLPSESKRLEERHGAHGGIFSKPFLRDVERQVYLGGYIDLEYFDSQDSDRRFAQHRFVPFLYVDVNDQVKFAAEIEFEYGGSDAPADDGETKVEFATIDYVFDDAFAFRAGAILVPLGKFNLIHDSPINDLTDRPLVDRFVIPTTFTEAGLGFFGILPPMGEWDISYEIYLVNGFRGLERDGDANFSDESGLRSGRGSFKTDNNNSAATTGRLAVSPFLGTEVGASFHIGDYDESGDLLLAIWAIDFIFKPGRFFESLTPLEILGEVATGEIERNALARSSGIPDGVWGVYGQVNYHFMFDSLVDLLPAVFKQESTFTATTRLDHVELGANKEERITFGLNFRPIEDFVFKFDYQLNFEDWDRNEVRNDTFAFSVASYF